MKMQDFTHDVIRTHNFMTSKTLMKRFAWNDAAAAMDYCRDLNAKAEGTAFWFIVKATPVKKAKK